MSKRVAPGPDCFLLIIMTYLTTLKGKKSLKSLAGFLEEHNKIWYLLEMLCIRHLYQNEDKKSSWSLPAEIIDIKGLVYRIEWGIFRS